MNLLYGFSNCSYKKYNSLFADSTAMVLQQAQKYHSLMASGIAENGVNIQCISGLPINRGFEKSLYIKGGNDEENGVLYHYFSSINLPLIRQLMLIIKSFFYTLFSKNKDCASCDILNISIAIGMLLGCKIRKIPIIGIVTDIPEMLSANGEGGIIRKINSRIMYKMDGYVLLTEQMNELVNPHNRPSVVIEGQADKQMASIKNEPQGKANPRVAMYAGSLKKIYGISRLVEAFVALSNSEWELHIYGDGDFREELEQICKNHANVKYMGVRLNKEIVEAEISASLLINPRPTDEEYTKYSFPSKNMEYMVSATPMLTTALPGMPAEYNDYVYIFSDETPKGMADTLKTIFDKPDEELYAFGQKAKSFVLENKNNVAQATKLVQLAERLKG